MQGLQIKDEIDLEWSTTKLDLASLPKHYLTLSKVKKPSNFYNGYMVNDISGYNTSPALGYHQDLFLNILLHQANLTDHYHRSKFLYKPFSYYYNGCMVNNKNSRLCTAEF